MNEFCRQFIQGWMVTSEGSAGKSFPGREVYETELTPRCFTSATWTALEGEPRTELLQAHTDLRAVNMMHILDSLGWANHAPRQSPTVF